MKDKDSLYARWISGEIDADELESLRKEGAIDDLKQIIETTDQWAMPSYNTTSGYNKFKSKYPGKDRKIVQLQWRWLAGVAAMLVLAVAVWTWVDNQGVTVQSKSGVNEMVTIEDGTNIIVNDGSTIQYSAKDWQTKRQVKLTGEAYFEVKTGSDFDVMTSNGTIKVIGTQFTVRAWGQNLYVECYEGKVQVIANGQETVLEQKQSVNVVAGTMKAKQPISNESPVWRNNSSRFFEEQLDVVFEELERQFDITIKAPLINRSFSGIFNHDKLEDALHSICKPLGLSYTISKDTKVVLIE